VSRVQRRGVKYSRDPIKNQEVLGDAPKLTGILSDMSKRISKLTGTSDNVLHSEIMNIALKYQKYSTKPALEEFTACRVRPLVTDCYVEKSVNTSRKLATTLIMYDYDVIMEGTNATVVAQAAADEVDGAELVHGLNLTVTSDQVLLAGANESEKTAFDGLSSQSFNVSDDDIFTFDTSVSQDVYLIDDFNYNYPTEQQLLGSPDGIFTFPGAPPPSSPAEVLSGYWLVGIGGVVAMMVGIAGFVFARSRSRTRAILASAEDKKQFINPILSDNSIDYSMNPIHTENSV
jgi:hypothetical protein